jgi:hypothetical protein
MEDNDRTDADPEYEDDKDSVATDTSDSDDDGAGAFELSSLRGSAKAGIEEQALSRVFYELETAAPKLSELGTYLQQARLKEQKDAERAADFQQKLSMLHDRLSRLILDFHTNTDSHSPTTRASSTVRDSAFCSPSRTPVPAPTPTIPAPTALRTTKRRAADIIGPSLEKASKRHNSYNYD